jgi:predicted dehydrogenase
MSERVTSRRDFVVDSSKAAFGAMILPRHVLGGAGYQAPSRTLNYAVIGMGQQGTENAESLVSENLVAVCDVHMDFTERQVRSKLKDREGKDRPDGIRLNDQFAKAKRYTDFRVMLEKQKDIDAVVIATPDHLHAPIAKVAMELGKHVYVQKPLTWSVHEARVLSRMAREQPTLVTQMGNQGHSSNEARLINEWIQAGVIGPVREVHVWTNRPIWPQGIARPAPMQPADNAGDLGWGRGQIADRMATSLFGDYSVPSGMNWELYLGPCAEDIPYHPIYHPFNWRGWTAFGVGALGDMGAHLIDQPYWALDLGFPTTIEATSTPWGGPRDAPQCYPLAMTAHYDFPATATRPGVRLSWFDGGLMPRRPDLLPETVVVDGQTRPFQLNSEGGVIFFGEKGILMHETYGRNPTLYPASLMEQAKLVPQTYPRIEGSHPMNWAKACKDEAKAVSPFEYAAALTEVMLLGIVALRAGQGRRIHYDAQSMAIRNVPEANQYLTRQYRAGWEV